MCRLAAYRGPSIALEDVIVRPAHSLLEQSHAAIEAKLRTNGDGFGIAWYVRGPVPGQYRDVLPAWSDGNLPSLCRMIEAPLFLAHVRASTLGETARANCHPFVHGRWSFMHNGQIPHVVTSRRALEATLPDALYDARRGTTDSELLFLLLLANGLDSDPLAAIPRTLAQIDEHQRPGMAATRLTCVMSDGERILAFRHATDRLSPGLYIGAMGPARCWRPSRWTGRRSDGRAFRRMPSRSSPTTEWRCTISGSPKRPREEPPAHPSSSPHGPPRPPRSRGALSAWGAPSSGRAPSRRSGRRGRPPPAPATWSSGY